MKRTTLITLFCVLGWVTLFAQEQKEQPKKSQNKNALRAQVGLEQGYYKDLNFSPLNYSSLGLAVKLAYERELRNNDQLFFSINPQLGRIRSEASEYTASDHYNVNLELGYLVDLPVKSQKIEAMVGGQLHTYLDLTFHGGTSAVSFFGLHSLDVIGRVSWNINEKQTITSNLSLPVFGLLVRPPYSGWDKYIVEHANNPLPVFYRGNWTSFNDYLAFSWNVQYEYQLAPTVDLIAEYQFSYHRTEQVKTAILPSNQITFGTRLKF